MSWWGWLLLVWPFVAVLIAVGIGAGMRTAESRDWVRRGRPDRRSRPRGGRDR